ncbi:MAG: hypothetical protein HOV86_22210 [Thermoactinospora sp.]|nr:hypothetical protein [Thermoactinospora sp.]
MTQEEAVTRVEQLVRSTAAVLRPRPRLELLPYSVTPNPCDYDDGEPSRFTVNRAYWLRDLPRESSADISRQIRAHWESSGHTITAQGSADKPSLFGVSHPDNYTLALVWAEGDALYLAATSPCL